MRERPRCIFIIIVSKSHKVTSSRLRVGVLKLWRFAFVLDDRKMAGSGQAVDATHVPGR